MLARTVLAVLLVAGLAWVDAPFAAAQSSSTYNACVARAQQQSGYYGSTPNQAQHAPLRGAAAGAVGGSLIGGMGGGDAGRGALIGASFGAIAGASRRREAQAAQQNAQNNFYNALNACLAQSPK